MCLNDSLEGKQSSNCNLTGLPKVKLRKQLFLWFPSHERAVVQVQVHRLCVSMINEREKVVAENQVAFRDWLEFSMRFFSSRFPRQTLLSTNRTSFHAPKWRKMSEKMFWSENEIAALSCGRHRSKLWCFPTSRINRKCTHKNYCYAEYLLHTRVDSISGRCNAKASL